MNKGELLQLLGMRLGNRTDSDILAALSLEITLAQDTLLEQNGRFKPWFLVSEFATAETVANDSRVELPEDFIGEVEEGGLYVLNPDSQKYVELVREDYDFLAEKYADATPSLPKEYSLDGDKYYRLFPTPDLIYTLRQRYFEKDVAFNLVADNSQNRWLKYASDLLLAIGGQQYASKHLQNQDLAIAFGLDVKLAWDRLKGEHEMREHSNRDYVMGD